MGYTKKDNAVKIALIVDDDVTNRMVLSGHLANMGYECIEAVNGKEAVELYKKNKDGLDLVLMDVMMPVMDGYEATNIIKSIDTDDYKPVIFITALSEKLNLGRCIKNGGDDFVTKPVKKEILKSKIVAHERIKVLHNKVNDMYKDMLNNQILAKRIYENILVENSREFEGIHKIFKPSDLFSGDLYLTHFTPSRDIYLLLADFTGHGLSAAIGALPVSMLFKQLSEKGVHIREVIKEINRTLYKLLPTEMFMAAQFVCIGHSLDHAKVYNFSMPEVMIIDAEDRSIKQRLESRGMALGIMDECEPLDAEYTVELKRDDTILMFTDGVTEYGSHAGMDFNEDFLITTLRESSDEFYSDSIYNKIAESNTEENQHDDISLLEIKCSPTILPPWDTRVILGRTSDSEFDQSAEVRELMSFDYVLHDQQLVDIDPVPMLSDIMNNYTAVVGHTQAIFSIIKELYEHGLHQGVLQKEVSTTDISITKDEYTQVEGHSISINVKLSKRDDRYQFVVSVKDSGIGFDYSSIEKSIADGCYEDIDRNIGRTTSICQLISFEENGTKVSAIYEWENI